MSTHLRQAWAQRIIGLYPRSGDVLFRAVRTMIPYTESEDSGITAAEIWKRVQAAMRVSPDGYVPERPGSWWFMEQYDATRRFNDAKFWAGGFTPWSGPNGKHAGVGVIYEAKYDGKPPENFKIPAGSQFLPGIKLVVVAVHVAMPNDTFARVPVNIKATT